MKGAVFKEHQIFRVPRGGVEHPTPASSEAMWTISSSLLKELGAVCKIIVGTHLLVSTPSRKPLPFLAWLGIGQHDWDSPEFTQFFSRTITDSGPKDI